MYVVGTFIYITYNKTIDIKSYIQCILYREKKPCLDNTRFN